MSTYQQSFRKIIAWKEAKELTLKIYSLTRKFPAQEQYGVTSQLRRASSSVMANIAEGNERKTAKDRLNFFWIARSSLAETDCFLELAADLKYMEKGEYESAVDQLNKTGFMLCKLITSLEI